jgi:hypothetical protein
MRPAAEWPELGVDQLDPATPEGRPRPLWWPRRRLALGVRTTAAPTLLFVLLGVALGPAGVDILSRAVLSRIEVIPWVALAVVGVYIGLGLAGAARPIAATTVIATGLIAVLIVGTVAIGLVVLISQAGIEVPGNLIAASVLIGLSASVSASMPTAAGRSPGLQHAAQLADLDDLPLLVFGTALVATLAGPSVTLRVMATVAGGGAIGIAGVLLFERASESERGLFISGTMLLLGGIGAYLGTSPLLAGCTAALVWVWMPGVADRITARDLRMLQHPLVALLLIVAGAMIRWDTVVVWTTAYVVVLRIAAKLLAALAVTRLVRVPPALLATVLLQPGVMGIALAVNVALVGGRDYDWVVSTVTASVAVSEVLAALLPYAREDGS